MGRLQEKWRASRFCPDMDPAAVVKRSRRAKHFWIANYFFVTWLYIRAYGLTLDPKGSIFLYLAYVSVHALVSAAANREESAETRLAAEADSGKSLDTDA